jgi:hypothetical protein
MMFSSFKPKGSNFKPRCHNLRFRDSNFQLMVNKVKRKALRLRLKNSRGKKLLAWMLINLLVK